MAELKACQSDFFLLSFNVCRLRAGHKWNLLCIQFCQRPWPVCRGSQISDLISFGHQRVVKPFNSADRAAPPENFPQDFRFHLLVAERPKPLAPLAIQLKPANVEMLSKSTNKLFFSKSSSIGNCKIETAKLFSFFLIPLTLRGVYRF